MSELLPITKIQRFSTHDGPGIRTTVFLKGCPLHCAWCHNPETQHSHPELMYADNLCIHCKACESLCPAGVHLFNEEHTLHREKCLSCGICADACPTKALEMVGKSMTVEDILRPVLQDAPFYGEAGGITLSGGEPMAHPEGTLALLRAAKEAGLHTALETCGHFPPQYLPALHEVTELFLWDYKDSDPLRHEKYTGVSNQLILQNLHALDGMGARVELRCILVKGVNLEEAHLDAIARTYHTLHHCTGVTLLPCHAYGESKARHLGRKEPFPREFVPSDEEVESARSFLREKGVLLLS